MERGGGAVNQKTRHLVDNYLNWLRRSLYPPACVLCNVATSSDDLCTPCANDLAKNYHACYHCALPLRNPLDRVCGPCLHNGPQFDYSHAPYLYEYPMDRLIQRFKFRGDLRCGRILAGLLLQSLQQNSLPNPAQALIPVPLYPKRLAERGFNQSLELARDVAKGLDLPALHNHLLRTRNTRAQSELGAGMRHANVRGAFEIRNAHELPKHVALIDDVMTTGSTVYECAQVLRKAGVQRVEVWLIARAG